MIERVISFNDNNNEYFSIVVEFRDDKVFFSGHLGRVLSDEELDQETEDYFKEIDLEDEYGYLADEKEIFDKSEREEYLNSVKSSLMEDYFPNEVLHYLMYMNYTLESCGQNIDDMYSNFKYSLTGNKNDLDMIKNFWNDFHMKRYYNLKPHIIKLLDKFPTFDEFDKTFKGHSEYKKNKRR